MLRFLLAGCLAFVAAEVSAVTLQFSGTFVTNNPTLFPNPQLCSQSVTLTASPNNGTDPRKTWGAIGPNGCAWEVVCVEVKPGVYMWGAILDSGNVVCQGAVYNATGPSGSPNFGGAHNGTPSASKSPIGCGPGTWTISP